MHNDSLLVSPLCACGCGLIADIDVLHDDRWQWIEPGRLNQSCLHAVVYGVGSYSANVAAYFEKIRAHRASRSVITDQQGALRGPDQEATSPSAEWLKGATWILDVLSEAVAVWWSNGDSKWSIEAASGFGIWVEQSAKTRDRFRLINIWTNEQWYCGFRGKRFSRESLNAASLAGCTETPVCIDCRQPATYAPYCVYCAHRSGQNVLGLTEEQMTAHMRSFQNIPEHEARQRMARADRKNTPPRSSSSRELAKGHPPSWPSVEGDDSPDPLFR